MKREILNDLIKWKDNKRRKPLLLTGVRQCGKTYILNEFGEQFFEDVCYINFESNSKYSGIFEYDYDIKRILKELEFATKQKIEIGKTLLIFDEIQVCPNAIVSLKYFCEECRELHLVCAGSLLGVALNHKNISFPVGKVNRMQMYPMSFKEYMWACGEGQYLDIFSDWPIDREIPILYKKPLENLLKEYYFVGGMPEVVKEYTSSKDFDVVTQIQDEILEDYADDFSKYAPFSEIEKIRMIWDSIPKQLSKENNKFVFSHVKKGKRGHELEAALQWLKNAGLISMLELVNNAEIPISVYADATYFKVFLADIGLLCRRLGLGIKDIREDNITLNTFKGAIAENYVLNELLRMGKKPFFWKSGNTAELDFIFEENGKIIPVEVKAAINTQAKSFKLFCKKYSIETGFKVSLKNIAKNNVGDTTAISLPLYLLWNMDLYNK